MKKLLSTLCAILFNCLAGAILGCAAGINPALGALGMNGVSAVVSLRGLPEGLREGVLVEIWTGEMIKKLRAGLVGTWLDGVPDMSSIVNNDVIHLVDVGADPEVLVNNTTYPLEIQELSDGDKAISLDKFETRPTSITDDELYAISYDKMARVRDSHSNSIKEKQFAKAAHALCANSNTSLTPVLATTGEADAATGRRKLTKADLLAAKSAMDKLGVPADSRRLVLCPDHVIDILGWSEQFEKQYSLDNANGKIERLYGFDVYEFSNNPFYTSNGVKKSLGATGDSGEFQCSFAFYVPRVFKATGSMNMYYSPAQSDPIYHRNLIDFLQRFIVLPKKEDSGVVIRSGYLSSAVPTITGDALIDNLSAEAGTVKRTYATSNGAAISAASDADWLTVSVGAGNKVSFTRTAYAHAAEGTDPRVANVTLTIPGTDASLTVVVKQAMASEA